MTEIPTGSKLEQIELAGGMENKLSGRVLTWQAHFNPWHQGERWGRKRKRGRKQTGRRDRRERIRRVIHSSEG